MHLAVASSKALLFNKSVLVQAFDVVQTNIFGVKRKGCYLQSHHRRLKRVYYFGKLTKAKLPCNLFYHSTKHLVRNLNHWQNICNVHVLKKFTHSGQTTLRHRPVKGERIVGVKGLYTKNSLTDISCVRTDWNKVQSFQRYFRTRLLHLITNKVF